MSEIYHTLNRGVDKRKIFVDDKDYLRFIHDLFEFNDENPPANNYYVFSKLASSQDVNFENSNRMPRSFLVNIHAFCLMPNHYHLLLTPKVEGGIAKFMKKLNMGYARYFNEKYDRSGALFEGRYKSVRVDNEAHFIHLPYYIHLNPLDIRFKGWRNRELYDSKEAIEFLKTYRWSSHLDYLGIKNFPSVTQRELLNNYFGSSQEYKDAVDNWLRDIDINTIKGLILEK